MNLRDGKSFLYKFTKQKNWQKWQMKVFVKN